MTTATLDRTTTTTLTLLPLNHRLLGRAALHQLDNQVQLHRTVMSLFPAHLDGPADRRRVAAGILYRLDQPAAGPPRLLVQHSCPLRPEHAEDPYLQHADLTPLLARLRPGAQVSFRVVLNPVRRRTGSSRFEPITEVTELEAWGAARLHAAGLDDVHLLDLPQVALWRAKAPLWVARFDGRAVIRDTDNLRVTVLTGLGRAKAYGCGLLSLALTG